MFSGPLSRLDFGIRSIKTVIELHDFARHLFFDPTFELEPEPIDLWQPMRSSRPDRLTWQIYDYCAAVTRLYTAYSTFIEDLVSAYLRMLPSLFDQYELLPPSVRTQHRVGSAQILLKIGKSGPFRHLREDDVFRVVGDAVGGHKPYSLFEKAFFVENQRQNYRLDALARVLGSLGIQNLGGAVSSHNAMRDFLERARGGSTTFEAELSRFVQLRNEAAHTEVEQIVATEELKTIADFVWTLCTILAEILESEVVARRFALGQLPVVGTVKEVYRKGFVVVVYARPTHIGIGDQVALVTKRKLTPGHITSIQDFGRGLDAVDPAEGQEVGLGLDRQCGLGYTLARVPKPSEYATYQTAASEKRAEEPSDVIEGEDVVEGSPSGGDEIGEG
jgi:hypothetical protein